MSISSFTFLRQLTHIINIWYLNKMQTTKIYRLPYQKSEIFERLKAAQIEAARVWNFCVEAHQIARRDSEVWPNQTRLQKLTKGKYQLHSQFSTNGLSGFFSKYRQY